MQCSEHSRSIFEMLSSFCLIVEFVYGLNLFGTFNQLVNQVAGSIKLYENLSFYKISFLSRFGAISWKKVCKSVDRLRQKNCKLSLHGSACFSLLVFFSILVSECILRSCCHSLHHHYFFAYFYHFSI